MGRIFDAVVIALYPLIVLLGLTYLNVRWTALLLLVLLGRRFLAAVLSDRAASLIVLVQALAMAGLIGGAAISNSGLLLRFTPFLISLIFLAQFGVSLRGTPIIERFARLQRPEMPPEQSAYCRALTKVWLLVLAGNSALVLAAAFVPSKTLWAVLVGPVSYAYLGIFIAAEYLFRKRRFQEFDRERVLDRLLEPLLGKGGTR
ncbi:MAG: hypothetical protein R6V85_05395 [Polyangia bacterium]